MVKHPILSVFIIFLIGSIFYFRFIYHGNILAQSFVVIGKPYLVVSVDPVSRAFSVIRIPSDIAIDATYGYGTYTLDALWKLDQMENRHGTLFTNSLEEALGIPVRAVYDSSFASSVNEKDTISSLNAVFSLVRLLPTVIFRHTTIDLMTLFSLSKNIQTLRPENLHEANISSMGVTFDQSLADGTIIQKINTDRVTMLLGTMFEREDIRREGMRIAVYNTTQTRGLAERASRIMGSIGLYIVAAGNVEQKVDQCLIRATRGTRASRSVAMITELFSCRFQEEASIDRADIEVLLGKEYEKLYPEN